MPSSAHLPSHQAAALPSPEAPSGTSLAPIADPSPPAQPVSCHPPTQLATLPDHMVALQARFLSAENVDAFLSIQDPEVLEYFHLNNRNSHLAEYQDSQ